MVVAERRIAELCIICGPTAAGKSALAMTLAEAHRAAIISADSRQIYRGFDIGTAKPTRTEQARAPHYGIDLIEPTERYSAAAWAAGAEEWMSDAVARDRIPLVVGGTGFYLRALTDPLFHEPPLDADRLTALRTELAPLGTAELRRWVARLDPPRAHLGRAQLARAVEVALLTGTPLSRWHARAPGAPRRAARYLLVDPGPSLTARIEGRLHDMMNAGWEEEVAALDARLPEGAPAWNATGYRAIRDLVRGVRSREAAIGRALIDTRQYVKRQRTWFRHQLPAGSVTVIDPAAPHSADAAARWLQRARART